MDSFLREIFNSYCDISQEINSKQLNTSLI